MSDDLALRIVLGATPADLPERFELRPGITVVDVAKHLAAIGADQGVEVAAAINQRVGQPIDTETEHPTSTAPTRTASPMAVRRTPSAAGATSATPPG